MAGGTIAAKEVLAGGSTMMTLTGAFSGPLVIAFPASPACTRTEMTTGTLTMQLEVADGGAVSGTAQLTGAVLAVSATCSGGFQPGDTVDQFDRLTPVTGTTGALVFRLDYVVSTPVPRLLSFAFVGALTDNTLTGTLTHTLTRQDVIGTGTATYSVTLR